MHQKMKMIVSKLKNKSFFKEKRVMMGNTFSQRESEIINVYDEVVRQEIVGFGGAFTEAAAYNYSLMNEKTKKAFLKAYFDKTEGIGYNFGRTHINSCDFSLDSYTYVKEGDETLHTFDISRDKKYILPFLKDALSYCKEKLILFASPWSPPGYMKDNGRMVCGGKLQEKYKNVWARYYAKYIKALKGEGIEVSAITVQNEPHAFQLWESCKYTPDEEREFVENHLIPVLDKEGLSHVKIIIWDHNKERIFDRAKRVLMSKTVNERVWAVGHHWYSGDHFEGLNLVYEEFGKPTICTEFCKENKSFESLSRMAEEYAKEMCENLNHYNIASCDWNLVLNKNGGPFHNRTLKTVSKKGKVYGDAAGGCLAPILYDSEKGSLLFTPAYYYIGHFSKYIHRGAKRIGCTKYTDKLSVCAFLNPNGERVVVVLNATDEALPAVIRYNDICTKLKSEAHSIMTLLF